MKVTNLHMLILLIEQSVAVNDLPAFSRLAATDESLKALVAAATSPAEIVALAADRGLHFSIAELREYSRNLGASHWPWANRGDSVRRAFFNQTEPPRKKADGRTGGWLPWGRKPPQA
ncbi:MAG: Nif11-like leader peptide family natural product precursor [Cyanobacteriota bacterium]